MHAMVMCIRVVHNDLGFAAIVKKLVLCAAPRLLLWTELDRSVPQDLRSCRAHLRRLLEIQTQEDEDRLVQLDAMRLQARTWNFVAVLAVASSPDLVGVEVLRVRVAGKVLFSRRILVAADSSDAIPYIRPVDSEERECGLSSGLMVDSVYDYELVGVVSESEDLRRLLRFARQQ